MVIVRIRPTGVMLAALDVAIVERRAKAKLRGLPYRQVPLTRALDILDPSGIG